MYLDSLIEGYSKRLILLALLAITLFVILEVALWQLQASNGDSHIEKINRQSLRKVRTSPVRGRMITSDGIVVVDNQPQFNAVLHTFEMRQPGAKSKTYLYIANKIIELSQKLHKPADVFTRSGLQELAKEQFNFDYTTFKNKFWKDKGQKLIKEHYFSNYLHRQDLPQKKQVALAWKGFFEHRHYADGIEQGASYNYRLMFNKIAKAKRVADKLYDRLLAKNGTNLTQDELWKILRSNQKSKEELLNQFSTAELIDAFGGYDSGIFEKERGHYYLRFKKQTYFGEKTRAEFTHWKSKSYLDKQSLGCKVTAYIYPSGEDPNKLLARVVNVNKAYTDLIIRDLRKSEPLPYVAFSNLDNLAIGRLSEMQYQFPGIELQISEKRIYPYHTFAAHLLGKTGKRLREDFEKEEKDSEAEHHKYYNPELKGRDGLELFYESELRGKPGTKMILVDYRGNSRKVMEEEKNINGNDLHLNINKKAQDAAEKALKRMHKKTGKNGTVVLLDVNTGAVLAMASYPNYDINQFNYNQLVKDKNRPLLNRAISEQYTPGSIMKPIIAMAAFKNGISDPDATYECTGKFYVDDAHKTKPLRCWIGRAPYYSSHGELSVVGALEQSCNPFFAHLGTMTGVANILPMLQLAGFGSKTGLDLRYGMTSGEVKGVIPTPSYLKRTHKRWNIADTARLSIGQGGIAVTPIQVACYVAAIANGGRVYQPHLVKSITTPDGQIVKTIKPVIRHELGVDPIYLNYIQEGMRRVVWGDKATAKVVRKAPIALAGKTGSAQVSRPLKVDGKNVYKEDGQLQYESFTNTWFMCYGPIANPKYACVVLVERGRSGGKTAAPVAVDLFSLWLGNK
jgi:penicillin-binding protein 2